MSTEVDERQANPNWRERLRQVGKAAFVQEEMERLGFWPASPEAAERAAEALAALRLRYDELAPLQDELRQVQKELSIAGDVTALLLEIRKRRIERVRAVREEKRKTQALQQEERKQQDRAWRQKTVPYLGRGVSGGLRYEGGDPERVSAQGLPVLATASDIAAAIGITEQSLAWLSYHRASAAVDHYTRFTIPKKRGGVRVISSPKAKLRIAQQWILEKILVPLPVHEAAVAFRPELCITDNAARHMGRPIVLKMDLQDFFPSITFRRVKGLFASFGYNEGVATILALLATETPRVGLTFEGQKRFVSIGERQLPQGACTSPALTNILCRTLDRRLTGAATAFGFVYTRYADDLVFSHPNATAPLGVMLALTRRILKDEDFRINEEKTAVMRPQDRQAVTGVVVNGSEPRISRRDMRRFRAFLHGCETQGIAAMSERLGRDASAYAQGYLAFVHMVNPTQAQELRRKHSWLSE